MLHSYKLSGNSLIAIIAIVIMFCNTDVLKSQTILGTYWTGSIEMYSSLDLTTDIFTNIDSIGVYMFNQGESTFDAINQRYFNKTTLGVLVIDALTGAIISMIPNSTAIKGIEYDSNTNKIFGTYWNGSDEIFTSIDLSTNMFTDIATLGVFSFYQGESTFDAINQRYFTKSSSGVLVIDALSGTITSTIPSSTAIKGIEYDSNTNKIFGTYWNGSDEIFTSIDLSTNIFTANISNLGNLSTAFGESSFDEINQRYFIKTNNLGILVIDALTGNILKSIPNPIALKGIEYKSLPSGTSVLTQDNMLVLNVYPNPITEYFQIQFGDNTIQISEAKIVTNNGNIAAIIKLEGSNGNYKGNASNLKLANGSYYLRIEENGIKISLPFIIIK